MRVLAGALNMETLKGARIPSDSKREVGSASDLSVGELVRLFQDPKHWRELRLPLDGPACVERFEEFNGIRNEVMHFSPDPLSDNALATLDTTRIWLQDVCRRLGARHETFSHLDE
jgi:hypothetical protein